MTNRFERFSYAISEIDYFWHRIAAEVLAEYGLKGSSSVYFTVLDRFPEGVTAAKLGTLSSRNKADVSRVVAQMEEKGFARREATGTTPYRARIILTERGMEVANHINAKAEAAANLASAGLSESQLEAFYEALELIAANMKKIGGGEISG